MVDVDFINKMFCIWSIYSSSGDIDHYSRNSLLLCRADIRDWSTHVFKFRQFGKKSMVAK